MFISNNKHTLVVKENFGETSEKVSKYCENDCRFIIGLNNCSTKPLSRVISKIFKMLFKHVENVHNKSTFYSRYKKSWVVENYFPIIEKINNMSTRKRV